jgi:tripartite-type tricarboxylate transporter receptor subunit TctC
VREQSRRTGQRARLHAVACAVVALSAWSAGARAQPFPTKPIRLIVPSAPGGGIDYTGRVVGLKLAEQFGQSVVIDNRAGASGMIGADTVAKAPADGYTLLVASTSLAVMPSIYRKVPFDIVRDFTAIGLVARSRNLLVVHPAVPVHSVRELVAYGKARPGSLMFSSSGLGRTSHLAGERFRQLTGVPLTHVPYKGTGPAIAAVIAGEVQLIFGTIPSVLPHVKGGRLRALGVASLKRSNVVPDVPTIAEGGVPDFEADSWYGIVGPIGMPPRIVKTLNDAINRTLALPETRERFETDGSEPEGGTADAFGGLIAAEVRHWASVVKAAGLRPE